MIGKSFGMKSSLVMLVAVGSLCLVGCGTKIKIRSYPAFYTPDLKYVAVVPFRSATQNPEAGTVVSENFARELMANNTYQVLSHNDLGALASQEDLMIYAKGGDGSAAASKLKLAGKVQGLLVGTVSTYNSSTRSEPRTDPIPIPDGNGGVKIMYRSYVLTHNEGNVAVSAAMIRISDGTQIHATASAVGHIVCEGESVAFDRDACLIQATEQAVRKLVQEFAVTIQEITISDKNFQTASDYYDAQWQFTSKFKVGDPKVIVMLQLPQVCDRNSFRIVIVRKDGREELASQDVMYEGAWAQFGKGFEFKIADLIKKGGPGSFQAKLYQGPVPVLTYSFKIQ
jgi:hypothetical protein